MKCKRLNQASKKIMKKTLKPPC